MYMFQCSIVWELGKWHVEDKFVCEWTEHLDFWMTNMCVCVCCHVLSIHKMTSSPKASFPNPKLSVFKCLGSFESWNE